jgi:predicted transcriptional regulator
MNKAKLKKIGRTVRVVKNADGSEDISAEALISDYTVIVPNDKFVLIYEKFLSVIADISHTDLKVFHALCFKVDRMNSFQGCKRVMDEVGKEVGLSVNTVRNSLTALKKTEFIHEHPNYKRVYIVNPEFMWQGDARYKQAVFKLILGKKLKDKGDQVVMSGLKVSALSKGNRYTDEEIEKLIKDE